MLIVMHCSYCARPAVLKIVSTLEDVCFEHALEFWTGLLAYARDPCVKHQELCSCEECEALRASARRAIAVSAAGPSPLNRECASLRLAS
jgi:hypothetical protein